MVDSKIQVTEGSEGTLAQVATYSITESSVTKNLQRIVPNNLSGTETGTASTPLRTDPTGTTTQPVSGTFFQATQPVSISSGTVTTVSTVTSVASIASVTPGTGAASLGKAEDGVHASGDTGVMALAVRNDAGTVLAATTGDYIPLTTDNTGALRTVSVGATQYVEDVAHSSGDTGTMFLAVRRDANTSLVTSDGDYAAPQVNADGALKVAITSGAGSGGTSIADEAAFTEASTSVTPIGGYYNSSEDTLVSGVIGAIGIDSARNVKTHEQYAPLAEDNTNQVIATQSRPVAGSTYSPSVYAPMTQVTKANLKASAGNVFSVLITNANAAVRYFQIHNKATAPAATDVPVISIPVAPGTGAVIPPLVIGENFLTRGGYYCSLGVGWAISTTFATFTDSATNTEHISVINYK